MVSFPFHEKTLEEKRLRSLADVAAAGTQAALTMAMAMSRRVFRAKLRRSAVCPEMAAWL